MSTETWKSDLKGSRDAFVDLVAPVVEKWTGGEVANIESVTKQSVADQLDQLAGVDAWDIKTGDGIRGVASRVQPLGPFDTFTIRKSRGSGAETEFEKRKRQINNDLLYPHYTVQAYYDESNWRLESAAIVRTKDLIKFIEHGTEGDKQTWYSDGDFGEGDYWVNETRRDGYQSFFCVDWDYLREQGVGVQLTKPYENPEETVAPRSQAFLDAFCSGGDD